MACAQVGAPVQNGVRRPISMIMRYAVDRWGDVNDEEQITFDVDK